MCQFARVTNCGSIKCRSPPLSLSHSSQQRQTGRALLCLSPPSPCYLRGRRRDKEGWSDGFSGGLTAGVVPLLSSVKEQEECYVSQGVHGLHHVSRFIPRVLLTHWIWCFVARWCSFPDLVRNGFGLGGWLCQVSIFFYFTPVPIWTQVFRSGLLLFDPFALELVGKLAILCLSVVKMPFCFRFLPQ